MYGAVKASSSAKFKSLQNHFSGSTTQYTPKDAAYDSQLGSYDAPFSGPGYEPEYRSSQSSSPAISAKSRNWQRDNIASSQHYDSLSPSEDIQPHSYSNTRSSKQPHRLMPKTASPDEPPAIEPGVEPWRKLKTKAGKTRQRLPLACIACRQKKIRCSGEQPTCRHCARNRVDCVYKTGGRRKRRSSAKKNAQEKTSERGSESTAESVHTDHGSQVSDHHIDSKTRTSEISSLSDPRQAVQIKKAQKSNNKQLYSDGSDVLPSKELQEHLFDVYFDRVYGQPYYLLHKQTDLRRLRNGTLPPVLVLSVCAVAARFSVDPKLVSNSPAFTRGEKWAAHARSLCLKKFDQPSFAILSALILLSVHEFGAGQENRSWSIAGQAIRMAFALKLHEEAPYDTESREIQSRNTFIHREIRRRTMWSCFMLDRFSSVATNQPFFINDDAIDISLPINERYLDANTPISASLLAENTYIELEDGLANSNESSDDRVGIAAMMSRAVAICGRLLARIPTKRKQGRTVMFHYEAIAHQNDGLLKALPSHLTWSRENVERHTNQGSISQYLLLHLCIPMTDALVYQKIDWCVGRGYESNFVNVAYGTAAAHALAAAGRISEVLRQGDRMQVTSFAPIAGHSALLSFAIQASYLASPNIQIQAITEDNCSACLKYLHRMSRFWGTFEDAEATLHKSFRSALDAVRDGTPNPFIQGYKLVYQFLPEPFGMGLIEPPAIMEWTESQLSTLDRKLELRSTAELFGSIHCARQDIVLHRPIQETINTTQNHLRATQSSQYIAGPGISGEEVQPSSHSEPTTADSMSLPTPRGSFSSIKTNRDIMMPYERADMCASLDSPARSSLASTKGIPYHGGLHGSTATSEEENYGYAMPMATSQPLMGGTNPYPVFAMHPASALPMLEIDNGGWHDGVEDNPFVLPDDVSSWFLPGTAPEASSVGHDGVFVAENGGIPTSSGHGGGPSSLGHGTNMHSNFDTI